jgi:hypothetical protein
MIPSHSNTNPPPEHKYLTMTTKYGVYPKLEAWFFLLYHEKQNKA